ncbi:MAG: RNA polymerase sigma factor [Acidimicrobiia bacterium]
MRDFGMESADSQIYDRNRHDLVRYATVLVGPEEAEGVVSTVVSQVLTRGGFEELEDPRSHLFRAVLRESKFASRRGRAESENAVDSGESAEWVFEPEVWDAVERLPLKQRAATYLFYWMELSVAETAALMDLRPATVKRYLRLARLRVGEALDG